MLKSNWEMAPSSPSFLSSLKEAAAIVSMGITVIAIK